MIAEVYNRKGVKKGWIFWGGLFIGSAPNELVQGEPGRGKKGEITTFKEGPFLSWSHDKQ